MSIYGYDNATASFPSRACRVAALVHEVLVEAE